MRVEHARFLYDPSYVSFATGAQYRSSMRAQLQEWDHVDVEWIEIRTYRLIGLLSVSTVKGS